MPIGGKPETEQNRRSIIFSFWLAEIYHPAKSIRPCFRHDSDTMSFMSSAASADGAPGAALLLLRPLLRAALLSHNCLLLLLRLALPEDGLGHGAGGRPAAAGGRRRGRAPGRLRAGLVERREPGAAAPALRRRAPRALSPPSRACERSRRARAARRGGRAPPLFPRASHSPPACRAPASPRSRRSRGSPWTPWRPSA